MTEIYIPKASRLCHELLDENVLQLEGDWLIQKRMVMDAQISDIRAVVGKRGGKNRVKNLAQKAGNSNEKEEDILLKQNVKQTSSKMSSKTMKWQPSISAKQR